MRKTSPFLIAFFLIVIITAFTGCWSYYKDDQYTVETIRDEAYVPVYGIDTSFRSIRSMAPQPIVESGKIYVLGNNLFQVEKMKGVHIINYSDKSKPVKIGFIKSGGASEIAVKNGYLVVNNGPDLVTIDITDYNKVKEVARVKNAFKTFYSESSEFLVPPVKGKYYVCPLVPSGQDLVGWKLEQNVSGAGCYNAP